MLFFFKAFKPGKVQFKWICQIWLTVFFCLGLKLSPIEDYWTSFSGAFLIICANYLFTEEDHNLLQFKKQEQCTFLHKYVQLEKNNKYSSCKCQFSGGKNLMFCFVCFWKVSVCKIPGNRSKRNLHSKTYPCLCSTRRGQEVFLVQVWP